MFQGNKDIYNVMYVTVRIAYLVLRSCMKEVAHKNPKTISIN